MKNIIRRQGQKNEDITSVRPTLIIKMDYQKMKWSNNAEKMKPSRKWGGGIKRTKNSRNNQPRKEAV
jgi:hypothetical protein